MLNLPKGASYEGYTLIIPSVAVGNVAQLAVDLLIANLRSCRRVGRLWSDAFVPIVGADPYDSMSEELCTAVDVYEADEERLLVVQVRSDCAGAVDGFIKAVEEMVERGVARTVILTSSHGHERRHPSSRLPRYLPSRALPIEELETLRWTNQIEEQEREAMRGSLLLDGETIGGELQGEEMEKVKGRIEGEEIEKKIEGEFQNKSKVMKIKGQIEGKSKEKKVKGQIEDKSMDKKVKGEFQGEELEKKIVDKMIEKKTEEKLQDKSREKKIKGQSQGEEMEKEVEGEFQGEEIEKKIEDKATEKKIQDKSEENMMEDKLAEKCEKKTEKTRNFPRISGGGLAISLLSRLDSSAHACAVVYVPCYEGDNVPDAIEFLGYLNSWLKVLPKDEDEKLRMELPPSWSHLFGNSAPVEIY